MEVILPDTTPVPPRPPTAIERALVVALAVVFLLVEVRMLPAAAAVLRRATSFWPLLWWCVKEGVPVFVAAYVIRGAWIGEILSAFLIVDLLVLRFLGRRFGGAVADDPVEIRDEDPPSFYSGVAFYFGVACALVFLLTR